MSELSGTGRLVTNTRDTVVAEARQTVKRGGRPQPVPPLQSGHLIGREALFREGHADR